MELYESAVMATKRKQFGWDRVVLAPVGDVQLGASGCAEDAFREYVERAVKMGAYMVGMGDYVDVLSPSNRQRVASAELYDSTTQAFEEMGQKHVERFLKLVEGTKGRWLGLLEGHHFFEFADGSTSDTRIAQALGAPFLGNCAMLKLSFDRTKPHWKYPGRRVQTKTIWLHHGAGSGVTPGAPLNKMERIVMAFRADIYLIGHYHRQVAYIPPELEMTHKPPYRVKARKRVVACTGGWLKGYEAGSLAPGGRPQGSYVEKRMLPPVAIGGIFIYLEPHDTNTEQIIDMRLEV